MAQSRLERLASCGPQLAEAIECQTLFAAIASELAGHCAELVDPDRLGPADDGDEIDLGRVRIASPAISRVVPVDQETAAITLVSRPSESLAAKLTVSPITVKLRA